MQVYDLQRRTWAEINLDAAKHNYMLVRRSIPEHVKICCVIKANGYGHGAVPLAKLYEELGAEQFAVSNIEEAIQLRHGGVAGAILVLGYTPANCVALLAHYGISQCVYSEEYATLLSKSAVASSCSVRIHIKIDTGMGRIGFRCLSPGQESLGELCDTIAGICHLPGFITEGIFMHFAVADEGENGEPYTRGQFAAFHTVVCELESRGIQFRVRHCANSAAILDYPEFCFDMVRAGVVLYGLAPSSQVRNPGDFRPVMSLKSVISHIKTIHAGDTVSYGRTFTADHTMQVATVPMGYADGFLRAYGTGGVKLCVKGVLAPIIGRVCMDQLMIDISHIPGCKLDEEVTIFGVHPAMTADDIADLIGTIGYEVVCGLGERVPRMYYRDGKLLYVRDALLDSD